MTDEQLTESWSLRGDLARSAAFSCGRDATGTQRWVQAERGKLGSGDTITVRVYRVYASDEEIEKTLDALYADFEAAVNNAPNIGGTFS